jgi:chromosome segregation ATPase
MASTDNVNVKAAMKTNKADFSGFLRAIDVDRLSPANNPEKPFLSSKTLNNQQEKVLNVRLLQATGFIVSAMWLIGAGIYVQRMVGWNNVSNLMPHEMGGFLAGILTPIALFWMIAAFILRSNDVKMYAEALREEIQTMIFPSDEANRRVNNDIERLMKQTAEMSRATNIVLNAIESAREGLRGQIQQMNGSGEQTVDRLNNLGQILNARMQDALKMGSQLEETITSIEERATNAEQRLTTSRNHLDESVLKIDQSTVSTEEAVMRLSQLLRERLEALGNLHQETEEALQSAASELSSQRDGIRIDAQAIEAKVHTIADVLQSGTDKLYEMTDDALDKARLIETKLQGQTVSLQSVLNQSNDNAAKIEQATAQAVGSLENAANNAASQTEKVESVLQQAIGRLENRTGDAAVTFTTITNQIQQLSDLFDTKKLQLDETGQSARQTAETIQSTLQNALDKIQKTTEALQSGVGTINASIQEPITLLENVATMAHQRAGDISQLLEARTAEMNESATQMTDEVAAAQQQLHLKGQDIALLAGKIAGHLKTVSIELDHQNTTLDNRLTHSLKTLDNLNTSQKNVAANLEKLQEQTAQVTEQTELSADTIKQRIDLLQQLHKSLATDAATSKGELDRVSDRLITISSSTVDKVRGAIETMTLLEADYHRLSDAGIDSIERLEKGYRSTLDTIQTETAMTAEKIAELQNGIVEKTEQASKELDSQLSILQDTAANVEQSIHKVNDFGNTIDLHLEKIGQFSDDIVKGNQQISINANSLHDILGQIKEQTIQTVDTFVQQGNDLEQNIQTQAARLTNIGQTFAFNTNQLKDDLAATAQEADKMTNKVQGYLGDLRDEANATETTLDSLAQLISNTAQTMSSQNSELQNSGDDIMARLQQATQQMGDKAAELEKAAIAAQQQAEALRNQENKLNQENFFNSTKFIVESLHSLALDFTRMLEGQLEEKTWRSYQKGDVGSFTRRLLSARDEETQGKIRTKFKEDVEFRTYVQRYLRQFEEIYDLANKNDHAFLLTSIFMTSDVGKLYQFICTILDRPSRSAAVH